MHSHVHSHPTMGHAPNKHSIENKHAAIKFTQVQSVANVARAALEAALTDPAASVKARARAINRQFEA